MIIDVHALGERRRIAAGALAPLADSLAQDLERLTQTGEIHIPAEKARLTRAGGRCAHCNVGLEFDPWERERHRCGICGSEFSGSEHDGMWIMWYQLWLAERATHAATLYATRGDERHRALAQRILALYAERYLSYPNCDNVLGPTRVFFSTYLESLWLLQLVCALDLLESSSGDASLGGTLRERLIQPSVALIAQFDEGLSNRQVWNNAAMLASGLVLGDPALTERALRGRSGLLVHLATALLPDGTWYEGENYHLFAHRGLWYGVTLAEAAGFELPADLQARYRRAFETPLLTALPDFTFPARRDSQYGVSLRQWRIAESCELGQAHSESAVLAGALHELYRQDVPRGDTGRQRSTSEAERNVPASRLTRADLGWKSLLFAGEDPMIADAPRATSVLLPDQGFAVMRRDAGRTYVALDYGTSGGGHGHPDRLNLWLVVGEVRLLEDVGTGSYVDPSLHWYRSTLAHNAPLANGQSQARNDGELLSYAERGDFGWTLARAALAPNVEAERAVVVAPDYMVDELSWTGAADTIIDLPLHLPPHAAAPGIAKWSESPIRGGQGLEDGFQYIDKSAHSDPINHVTIAGMTEGHAFTVRTIADAPFVLWRVHAPGPPNAPARAFFIIRAVGSKGRVRSVFDWNDAVVEVEATDDELIVFRRDGSRHVHLRRENSWRVAGARGLVTLADGATTSALMQQQKPASASRSQHRVPVLESLHAAPGSLVAGHMGALRFDLSAEHYRRSEQTWHEAGQPSAKVALAATSSQLHIDIVVDKSPVFFAPARSQNPLDNEHPDINSDGVELFIGEWSWLLVPEEGSPLVRVTAREGVAAAPQILAVWCLTSTGYALRVELPRSALPGSGRAFDADILVNEISADRERRRGQLVLSGAHGEWIYLRGDRQERSRFPRFVIANG